MDLSSLKVLSDAGGWAVAVALLIATVTLFLRGDIVPRAVSDAHKARGEAADKTMGELVPMVREISSTQKVAAVQMEFLVDMAKDRWRDRPSHGPGT